MNDPAAAKEFLKYLTPEEVLGLAEILLATWFQAFVAARHGPGEVDIVIAGSESIVVPVVENLYRRAKERGWVER